LHRVRYIDVEMQQRNQIADNTPLKLYIEMLFGKKWDETCKRKGKKNIEKLTNWLDEDPKWRPYVLWMNAKMIDACIKKFRRNGLMYAKASCDFIAGVFVEGEPLLVGRECKAQVGTGSHQKERAHTDFLSRFHTASTSSTTIETDDGGTLHSIIEEDSIHFPTYVDSTREAVQLLNQAFWYLLEVHLEV
jgi:hypothetical protein